MGTPVCLMGRYPLFNQRWDLELIMDRIGLHEQNNEAARILIREMEEFRMRSIGMNLLTTRFASSTTTRLETKPL